MRAVVDLQHIENQRPITAKEDGSFLLEMQRALLLALQEFGVLNDTEYRFAEDRLHMQFKKGSVG